MTLFLKIGLAQLLVGWVSGGVRDGGVGFHASTQPSVRDGGVGFHASTQPTLIFYLKVIDGLVVV
ncbi:hypothetical protein FHK94_02135 [Cylindrospermopsis raciborskii CS-506_D]|nr:hypothetical protein [Cylindrospermopsis raciborskii CS-506_D]